MKHVILERRTFIRFNQGFYFEFYVTYLQIERYVRGLALINF